MKAVVTAWQMREVDGQQVLNDHSDAAYDAGVLADVAALHAGVGPWLDTACSHWAPANVGHGFYPYGILPLAAVRVAAVAAERAGVPHAASYAEIPTVGRVAATLADLVSLACAFLLGRSLGGRRAGLVAAALYAFAILPLQLARFYTVDSFATAFAALALGLAVRAKIFQMKKATAKLHMADLNAGKYWGVCHNGTKSFKTVNWARSHKK